MKNLIFLCLSTFFLYGITETAIAQDSKGDILIEGGLGYGSEIQSLGIQAGGLYTINKQFRAAGDIIYYLPGEDSNGVEFSWFEFNANGHYLFINQEKTKAYLLTGLNFAKLISDNDNIHLPGGDSTDQIYAGLNIGAGAEFSLGSIFGYLEGKYALSSAHQLALTAGIRIPL